VYAAWPRLGRALNAFPEVICKHAQIYYWPLDKRELNASGKPGKLHAKVAVVDDQAVFSSANLTDDAFTRNLELGTLFLTQRFFNAFEGTLMAYAQMAR
jgi:phosphatidylserine/phosphatidylglycerophosphate/cardiolipin synthase-like enzyme